MGFGTGISLGGIIAVEIISLVSYGKTGFEGLPIKTIMTLIEPILLALSFQIGVLSGFQILDWWQGKSGQSYNCYKSGFLTGFFIGFSAVLGAEIKGQTMIRIASMILGISGLYYSDKLQILTPEQCNVW